MSPERVLYVEMPVIRREAPKVVNKKAADYSKTRSWGAAINKRLSQNGVWRK